MSRGLLTMPFVCSLMFYGNAALRTFAVIFTLPITEDEPSSSSRLLLFIFPSQNLLLLISLGVADGKKLDLSGLGNIFRGDAFLLLKLAGIVLILLTWREEFLNSGCGIGFSLRLVVGFCIYGGWELRRLKFWKLISEALFIICI